MRTHPLMKKEEGSGDHTIIIIIMQFIPLLRNLEEIVSVQAVAKIL